MPHYWLVHEIDGVPVVFIQEARAPIFAMIKAAMAGFETPDAAFPKFVELDAKAVRTIPKEMPFRSDPPNGDAGPWKSARSLGERRERPCPII